jgi:hypothetical protein
MSAEMFVVGGMLMEANDGMLYVCTHAHLYVSSRFLQKMKMMVGRIVFSENIIW